MTLEQDLLVTDQLTAQAMGSGTLPVLATPTVGTAMNLRHLRASAVGETIRCRATLVQHEGRRYTFALAATNGAGDTVGEGTHERFAVEVERFMGKLKRG